MANAQTKIKLENANGTTAWVDSDRVKNLVANGWNVVDDQQPEQPATATATPEMKTQPLWVGPSRGLFLAFISLANRAEGVDVDELTSVLGVSKETVYLTAGEMMKAHYLTKVRHPVDGRKSVYIAIAMPSIWSEGEVSAIIKAYKERIKAQEDDDSGELPLMRKKPEAPTECAMARALANTKPILIGSVPAYKEMLDFIVKAPTDHTTRELSEIIDEFIEFLQRRIVSARHDCPLCRARGSIENVHNAVHCVKCNKTIDGFGSFDENFKALLQIARARRED
jgi:hypothetical protein